MKHPDLPEDLQRGLLEEARLKPHPEYCPRHYVKCHRDPEAGFGNVYNMICPVCIRTSPGNRWHLGGLYTREDVAKARTRHVIIFGAAIDRLDPGPFTSERRWGRLSKRLERK